MRTCAWRVADADWPSHESGLPAWPNTSSASFSRVLAGLVRTPNTYVTMSAEPSTTTMA